MIRQWFVLLVALGAAASNAAAAAPARIAIIIDDLGYQLAAGQRAIALPGPIAYAILPGTPRGRMLAETAHRSGKEVLLHLPLQAIEPGEPDEPSAITLEMSHTALQSAFADALQSVPFAIGVSSHRGSLLTRHPGHMGWLMQEIRGRDGLFFIDSYTTPRSVALQIAREAGLNAARRDVFLDTDRSMVAVAREFERLKALARQRGVAVGIGHPYPETLEFLERELGMLDGEQFVLIPISEALPGFIEPAVASGF